MNELQEYLFDKKDQLKEIHYIDLMNLCLKIHKKFEQINNVVIRSIDNEYTRSVDISDQQWIGSFLQNQTIFFQFVMSKLNLEDEENICNTKITFPSSLRALQRQKIHIYISMSNSTYTPCKSKSIEDSEGNRQLSIYLTKEFLQLEQLI
jgi:hypothetical protein